MLAEGHRAGKLGGLSLDDCQRGLAALQPVDRDRNTCSDTDVDGQFCATAQFLIAEAEAHREPGTPSKQIGRRRLVTCGQLVPSLALAAAASSVPTGHGYPV